MASPQLPTFGGLLKRLRRAAQLTQEELAARAGYSASYLSALERGAREPPLSTVDLLAEILALDPSTRATLLATTRSHRRPRTDHKADQWAERVERASGVGVRSAVLGSAPPLVGRASELARLQRQLQGAGPPLLLVTGEPGIGKTRLLQEISGRAQAGGWTVLEGGCHRRSGQEPYSPVLGALERYVRGCPAVQLRHTLDGCAWIVRLLPELADNAIVPVPQWTLPPEQERRLMFVAAEHFLANLAGTAGTLLVLDDLHWAGVDAWDLLATFIRSTSNVALRVLGAYRDTDVRPDDPLPAWLSDLARDGLVGHTRLGPLAPDEASELLHALLEEGPTALSANSSLRAQVLQRADGVPFFLVSCAQGLRTGAPDADSGGGNRAGVIDADPAVDAVPWNVTQSLNQRVAALPPSGRVVLEIVAVGGRGSHRSMLLAVGEQLGLDAHAVLAGLEASGRARLLDEQGEQAYQVAHDLIREAILAELSSARRTLLHHLIAQALEHASGEPPISALAYHFQRSGDLAKAAIYLKRAGDRAWYMHANAEAEASYRELIAALERLGQVVDGAHAREELGRVLTTMARYDQALAVLEQAVELFQILGDPEGLGRAIAQIGEIHAARGTPEEGVARLQPLLQAASDYRSPRTLASLHIALAQLYSLSGRHREQLSTAQRASELARAAEDDRLLGVAEHDRGTALLMLGRNQEGQHVLEEAIPLLEAAGPSRSLAFALNNLAVVCEACGDFAGDRAYVERALAVAERMGDPTVIGFMTRRRGVNAFYRGEWLSARVDYERAVEIVRQTDPSWISAYPPLGLGEIYLASGEWEAAERALHECIALAERTGDLQALQLAHTALAERELLLGLPLAARARLEPLLERSEQNIEVTQLLSPLAWAYLELGDMAHAHALVARAVLLAAPERNLFELAAARRIEARLAMRQERWPEAEAAVEASLALSRAMPYPYGEAKALYISGLLLAARGKPAPARERFKQALAICGQLGERLYAEQIERVLTAARRRERSPAQALRQRALPHSRR
jgi:tetratricopeptide (TPR) repeat protein/transcriptional regulator with XRE-family HTH domain